MSENRKGRLLRSQSLKVPSSNTLLSNQKQLAFSVKKRSEIVERTKAKSEKEPDTVALVTQLNKTPVKRLIRDENCGVSCNDVSPSKRLRNMAESPLARLPLSPRKDVDGSSNVGWSPLRHRTPSKLLVVAGASPQPVQPHTSVGTPSHSSILLSSVSKTPSSQPKSVALLQSPSRSSRRNLNMSFGGVAAMLDENAPPNVTASLRLAKKSGVCYQSTKQVLHTSLPSDDLVGRATESQFIGDFLSEHLTQQKSGSLYVSGAPGTGKTAVLLKAMERLKSDVKKQYKSIYINCMTMKNSQEIYKGILSSLNGKDVHSSAKHSMTDIEKHFTQSKSMCVLVLDEMDSLDSKNQEVLYTIFEWPSIPSSKLILIGIANSLDLTDRILPRLNARSWCRPRLLHFAPYSREEIVAIINHRLSQVPDGETMIESNAVQMCARKMSAVAGDARAAIDVCRRAVEAVEADCRKQLRLEISSATKSPSKREPVFRKVGLKDVLKVVGEATGGWSRAGTQSDNSMTLPLQHHVAICTLLLMLSDRNNKVTTKEVTLGKFHETFCRVCKQQGISTIEQSDFLTLCELVETRGIFAMKKARDTRAIKVCLKMNEQELEKLLQDKTLMSSILNKGLATL